MSVINDANADPNVELAFIAVDLQDCAATGGLRTLGKKASRKFAKKNNRCPGKGPGRFLGALFSFPEGTPIWTEDGFTPIEDIEVGDLVWSRDELTGENMLNPVTELFRRETTEMSVLTVKVDEPSVDDLLVLASADDNDPGSASGASARPLTRDVRLTPEHPVYVAYRNGEEFGWTQAGMLVAGDLVADVDGGAFVKVVSNQLTATSETVYNFEVANFHSYFADELGLWVHNAKAPYTLSALRRAYEKACAKIGGCDGLRKFKGKFGSPSRGDSKCGIRLDPAGDKEGKGAHVNWWDYRGGKRGSGGSSGSFPIE